MSKVRVAVVGCGSVSNSYVPHLANNPYVELVSVCDNRIEYAKRHAEKFNIATHFSDVDRMIKEVKIDLLVNLTSMPFHGPLNRKALEAGMNVWCEKPISTDLADAHDLMKLAQRKGVNLWGAPNSPLSPAFAELSKIVHNGEIGKACAAQGFYGHGGTTWGPWFYRKGGGSLFDLGVYNVTTLSALLGPVQSVMAMAAIAVPQRVIEGENVVVEADDNTALVMDHGHGVLSVIQTGFVFQRQKEDWTIQVMGTQGAAVMEGYDWGPAGVQICDGQTGVWSRRCTDQQNYAWEGGASYIAECLATGKQPRIHGEHALHVLEIMLSALQSSETGRKVNIESNFPWETYRY
jgi:predicted dehydrogenase